MALKSVEFRKQERVGKNKILENFGEKSLRVFVFRKDKLAESVRKAEVKPGEREILERKSAITDGRNVKVRTGGDGKVGMKSSAMDDGDENEPPETDLRDTDDKDAEEKDEEEITNENKEINQGPFSFHFLELEHDR